MYKQKYISLLFLTIALIGTSLAQDCTFGGVNYSGFTLNATTNLQEYSSTQGQTQYVWNVCATSPTCVAKAIAGSASCQLSSGQWRNTGLLNTGVFSALEGVVGAQITYGGGPICNGNKQARTTKVEMTCAEGQPTKIVGADESSTACIYEVKLSGNAACGGGDNSGSGGKNSSSDKKKPSIGGGWVFIIILVCGSVLYVAAGSIVNAKVRHLHGKEIFPNYHFWADTFPGLLKDGVLFIKSKVTGTSASSAGYQQV
ncbi:hypothetical protein DLAC_04799 [Tieghemostelium lacteum]|uniref:Autophagy-related protein 27 n=1 Tax=Tieghemostelium lacteum TaxID=361077 RepID=A0A151ZL30_TIELA|nr:hypothetical protein DLAC_04799 [Tieghemostelium lacteum]|eukprot:KYQ94494.1 hypothetical protein DLAC_04799 [Tieghemostelium lacteum]